MQLLSASVLAPRTQLKLRVVFWLCTNPYVWLLVGAEPLSGHGRRTGQSPHSRAQQQQEEDGEANELLSLLAEVGWSGTAGGGQCIEVPALITAGVQQQLPQQQQLCIVF